MLLLPQADTNCPVFSRDEHEMFCRRYFVYSQIYILCLEGHGIMEVVKIDIFARFTNLLHILTTPIYATAFFLTHLLPMHTFSTP